MSNFVDEILAAYDKGFDIAVDTIKKELIRRINVTNTLPDQQIAYKHFLEWIESSDRKSKT